MKKLICKILGHKMYPFWNYDKPYRCVQYLADNITAVSFNQWKCDRCGFTGSAYKQIENNEQIN